MVQHALASVCYLSPVQWAFQVQNDVYAVVLSNDEVTFDYDAVSLDITPLAAASWPCNCRFPKTGNANDLQSSSLS